MATFSYDSFNIKNPWMTKADSQQEETAVKKQETITVPMVNVQKSQTPATLTAEGNVPFVSNKTDNTGITFEKTTNNTDKKAETKNETAKAENTSEKHHHKAKRTIDQAMEKSYPNWNKMTDDEKEQKILDHMQTIPKGKFAYLATKDQPDGRIGWLKSFLLNDKMTEKESRLVVGTLKHLNVSKKEFAELQAQGVKMAFDDDNIHQEACQLQVTEDMTKYGLTAQRVAVDKSSTSRFDSVKMSGASKASGLNADIHDYAVEKYMQGAKTSSEKVQKQIGHIIIDQYKDFAVEKQVKIHEIVSKSKISEIVEYAASNIYHFDKSNQKSAVDVTIATGNEKAINAAAAKANYYDESVRNSIKDTIYNSGYESAKSNWDNAPAVETSTKSASTQTESTSQTTAETKTAAAQVKDLMKTGAINTSELNTILKNASVGELQDIFRSLTPSEKVQAMKIMISNGASMKDLACINNMMGQSGISEKDKTELLKNLTQSYSTNLLASQSSISNDESFVRLMHDKGRMEVIKENELTGSAKKTYIELIG